MMARGVSISVAKVKIYHFLKIAVLNIFFWHIVVQKNFFFCANYCCEYYFAKCLSSHPFLQNVHLDNFLCKVVWIIFLQCLLRKPAIVWRKWWKLVIWTKPNSAFYLYYDKALLLFSRPMRVKDTSALREIFQHYSLVRSLSTNAR